MRTVASRLSATESEQASCCAMFLSGSNPGSPRKRMHCVPFFQPLLLLRFGAHAVGVDRRYVMILMDKIVVIGRSHQSGLSSARASFCAHVTYGQSQTCKHKLVEKHRMIARRDHLGQQCEQWMIQQSPRIWCLAARVVPATTKLHTHKLLTRAQRRRSRGISFCFGAEYFLRT